MNCRPPNANPFMAAGQAARCWFRPDECGLNWPPKVPKDNWRSGLIWSSLNDNCKLLLRIIALSTLSLWFRNNVWFRIKGVVVFPATWGGEECWFLWLRVLFILGLDWYAAIFCENVMKFRIFHCWQVRHLGSYATSTQAPKLKSRPKCA
jgi:hypothetical protein